jgi:hypothetical protein
MVAKRKTRLTLKAAASCPWAEAEPQLRRPAESLFVEDKQRWQRSRALLLLHPEAAARRKRGPNRLECQLAIMRGS